jgi:hypothetical protein
MRHIVTKKVVGGSRRLFFENPARLIGYGHLTMVFCGWLGVELFYSKCELLPRSDCFYVDLPIWRYRFLRNISCICVVGDLVFGEFTIGLSDKFEDLTD